LSATSNWQEAVSNVDTSIQLEVIFGDYLLDVVMAGLVPAIHVSDAQIEERGCPGQARA
jgi:hypothetical protein